MPDKDLCLWSLDDGEVRGLSSLAILKRLMETINPDASPKPCEYFDMIGGTSTGGLIARDGKVDRRKKTSIYLFYWVHGMNSLQIFSIAPHWYRPLRYVLAPVEYSGRRKCIDSKLVSLLKQAAFSFSHHLSSLLGLVNHGALSFIYLFI